MRGVFLGVFGACCWGFSGVCVNFLTSGYGVSSPWLGFMRLTLAGMIFAIAAVLVDKNNLLGLLRDRKAMISVTLFALFGMALYQISYIMAIHTAGAATESLLCEMSLIYIMVFSCIHEHRRPRRSELAAIVLAVAGVYCIATKGDPSTIAIGLVGLAWCALDGVLQFLHNVLPLDARERKRRRHAHWRDDSRPCGPALVCPGQLRRRRMGRIHRDGDNWRRLRIPVQHAGPQRRRPGNWKPDLGV